MNSTTRGTIGLGSAQSKGRGSSLFVFEPTAAKHGEPLPADHPFRSVENILATSHIGYVTKDLYRIVHADAAVDIAIWIEGTRSARKLRDE
jgi:lactate dehydrogenase-like 2-hydroxyacid dehydrogenase